MGTSYFEDVEGGSAFRVRNVIAKYFFLGAVLVSLFVFSNWINIPLTDQHAFRQTQTALSAFWLAENGDWLTPYRYETPNLGSPWTNPMEFPVYQWLVAALTTICGTSMDVTGRVVSIAAFYACLGWIYVLVKDGGGTRRLFFLIAAPLLLSPLYLFWSRTFMIESTAICCSLGFLALLNRFLIRKSPEWWAGSVVFGVLAVLTKLTTFPAFLVAALALIYVRCCPNGWRKLWRVPLLALLSLAICLGSGVAWVRYSDSVKSQTVSGNYLTSKKMGSWNYGPASLRFSSKLWLDTIWKRAIPEAVGGPVSLAICGGGIFFSGKRARRVIIALLGLFLLPFLIFTNLHVVHNYYQYSTSIFLIAALGIALHGLSLHLPIRLWIPVLLAVAASQLLLFVEVYVPSFERSWRERDFLIARYLKSMTKPGQVLVIFGSEGSSVIPYYAERKAFNVPLHLTSSELEHVLQHIPEHMGNLPVGAVILNGTGLDRYAISSVTLINRIAALKLGSRVEKHGYYVIFFRMLGSSFRSFSWNDWFFYHHPSTADEPLPNGRWKGRNWLVPIFRQIGGAEIVYEEFRPAPGLG